MSVRPVPTPAADSGQRHSPAESEMRVQLAAFDRLLARFATKVCEIQALPLATEQELRLPPGDVCEDTRRH